MYKALQSKKGKKKFKENELIVKFKNAYDVQSLGAVQGALGLKTKKDLGGIRELSLWSLNPGLK
ncbi:hypothetical protein GCM10020331_025150 [Ectobacillus funiculus]